MGIERVNSVFDIPSIQKEYDAFVAGLSDSQKAVVQLFTTIQGYKGTTLATIGKETDKLAASTAKVVKVTEQMNDAVTKAERAKAAALKTDQQVLKVMQEEEKVLQQTTRTKQATTKLEETLLRQKQRLAKEMEKESAAAKQTANAYDILKARYNQAANESKALAAQLWMTAKGDKAMYDQLIKDNKAYQDVTAAAQKYYGQLDQLETSIGQYQRRVGQYERSNYALSNSFSQLTREAPAFANSVQTGLMGLSNNIPIFADAVAMARKEGKSFTEILKTLGVSLFSFGGIITIATTLLTFLPSLLQAASTKSKDYGESLKDASGKTGLAGDALSKYNEALGESLQPMAEAQVKLQSLSERVKKGGLTYKEKEVILQDYNKEFGDTIGNAKTYNELESILISKAPQYLEYLQLKIKAQAAFNAATKEQEELLKNGPETTFLQNIGTVLKTQLNPFDTYAEDVLESTADVIQNAEKNYTKSQKVIDDLIQEGVRIQGEADAKRVQYNFDAEKTKTKDHAAEAKNREELMRRNAEAEFQITKMRLEFSKDQSRTIVDDEKAEYLDRKLAANDFYIDSLQLLQKEREFELTNKDLTAKEKEIIELNFHLRSIEATQDYYKQLYDITKQNEDALSAEVDRAFKGREKAIEDALKRGPSASIKLFDKDQLKKDFQVFADELQRIQQGFGNIGNVFGELFSIGIDTQKVKLQELEAEQQKAYENEVKRITASSLTEEEKANKLKILESERQAQKEANDRRTKKLEVDRARFQKAQDIANIISGTAVAVINALGAKPWTPLNIALAASIGALGAAQLAKAIAVPLPKYAEGTDSSKGGWALTDEKGPELYIEPGGSTYFGNDKPTLRNLRPGTKIIPSDEVNQFLQRAMMAETAKQLQMASGYTNDERSHELAEIKEAIVAQTDATIREMRRQKKQTNIKNIIDLGWGSYVKDKTFN